MHFAPPPCLLRILVLLGDMLLSGHDGGLVILWRKSERHTPPTTNFETFHPDQKHNQETWNVLRIMRSLWPAVLQKSQLSEHGLASVHLHGVPWAAHVKAAQTVQCAVPLLSFFRFLGATRRMCTVWL